MACSYCRERGHNIRKCGQKKLDEIIPQTTTIANIDGIANKMHDSETNHSHSDKNKDIKYIKDQNVSNKVNNPDKIFVEENEKKILKEINKQEEIPVEKLDENDNEGYIYIYKLKDPLNLDQKSWYKVGRTKRLPLRRIEEQAKLNKEKYTCIDSHPVSNQFKAENLIHRALKEYNFKRNDIKVGKTEWFKCERRKIMNICNLLVKLVNYMDDNDELEDILDTL